MNELGMVSGMDLGAILATAAALLAFGVGYNWLVSQWSRHGYNDGYTWLLVVVGVAVTVLAAGFTIGWLAVLLLLVYFVASGLPMAAGDIWRHVQARRAEQRDHE